MAWQFVPQNSSDSSGRKAQYKGELKRVNFSTNFVKKKKKKILMTTVDARHSHGAMQKLEPHWWTYLGFDILGSIFWFPLFQR